MKTRNNTQIILVVFASLLVMGCYDLEKKEADLVLNSAKPLHAFNTLKVKNTFTKPDLKQVQKPLQIHSQTTQDSSSQLAQGHKEIRRLLGNDIGAMQFDTQAAKNFRTFIANSILETTSYNSSSGYNNYNRTSGSGKIQLCADGTYVEALYSEVIVDVGETSGTSSGTIYISGFWEVAALPNGLFIILFYSQHPFVLEDFPNGFQPWIVPKYGNDFVAMPNGEFYKRYSKQFCN